MADNATLLLTLKMVKRGAGAGKRLEELASGVLGKLGWKVDGVEQLFANGRHERTLIAHLVPSK